jgi:Ca2+-transporting ATPase
LPIHLVWLELIVHPVSALVFQAEQATASVMSRPPRDPSAPLLPRSAIVRSSAAGVLLAAAAFTAYWWQSAAVGELQARALALIVLLAGYQVLLFAERLALPGSVRRIPRTPVFWIVWVASAISFVVILSVPSVAELFRVALPSRLGIVSAAFTGIVCVIWRLIMDSARAGET